MLYFRPPDWWPEPVPEGYVLQLMTCVYCTRQAAQQRDVRISAWTEARGYLAVNSKMTIFMKRASEDWIIHGLYVDDMMRRRARS